MKTIIAGSRHISDYEALKITLADADWPIDEVVSGGCHGVDLMGEQWAKEHDIPVKRFVANWMEYGRMAGELRNREMANYADGLILLWDGKSPGASCMLREAHRAGIKVYTQIYGLDMNALDQTEQAILDHYWHGGGRLVYMDGHWAWETASEDAPDISQFAIDNLVRRGMLEEHDIKVLLTSTLRP